MFSLFSMIILSLLFCLILLVMGLSLSKKMKLDREKGSPFECGFSPKMNARLPFSMRFFLVCLIFLVFDVELILMFPYILSMIGGKKFLVSFMMMIFLVVLIMGLFHEWNQGSLDWSL